MGTQHWLNGSHEIPTTRRYLPKVRSLAARNILNLQSKLAVIEERLDRLDEDSRRRRDPGLRCWETFEDDYENEDNLGHKSAVERRELFDRLERRMNDYRQY